MKDRSLLKFATSLAKVLALATGIVVLLLIILAPASRVERQFPEREKVVFWHMWTAEWKGVVDKIVARFNESQEDYEVIALSVPEGADAKFLLAVAGGSPPDLMAQWNSVIPAWAERGALMALDELMTPAELSEFQASVFPAIWDIGNYKDHFYGLCVGANAVALYYRPSHFEAVGLDPDAPPRTIEELDAMAALLTKTHDNGDIARLGFLPSALHEWAPGFGGGFYDDTAHKLVIESPENTRALEWINSYYSERHRYEQVSRFTSSLQQGQGGGFDWPFLAGAFSIVFDGQWRIGQLAKFAPELDYRTAPLPTASGGKAGAGWCTGNFMIVPSGAACPEGAWAFMKFWSGLDNPEVAAEFYTWGGWLPINQHVANAPAYRDYLEKHPQFQTFVDALADGDRQVAPPVPLQAFFMNRLYQMEQAVIRQDMTAQEGLRHLRVEFNREEARIAARE